MAASACLAFDFGTQHIGVAMGHLCTGIAQPLTELPVTHHQPDWPAVQRLIDEWAVDVFVIGLPLGQSPQAELLCRSVKKFAGRLHGRFNKPCYLHDERLTSQEAQAVTKEINDHLRSTGKRQRSQQSVHALSASLILESWLRTQKT